MFHHSRMRQRQDAIANKVLVTVPHYFPTVLCEHYLADMW